MPSPGDPRPLQVNVYIDGYNFYYAIKKRAGADLELLKLAWCNYWALGERRAAATFRSCQVSAVKCFTATIPPSLHPNPEGLRRKEMFLEALHSASRGGCS